MEYLAHHGILGQKWGVRRFQNEDGTLTEAGKKRYGKYVEALNTYDSARRSAREADNKAFDYLYSKRGKDIEEDPYSEKIQSQHLYLDDKKYKELWDDFALKRDLTKISYENMMEESKKWNLSPVIIKRLSDRVESQYRYDLRVDTLKRNKNNLLERAKKEDRYNSEFLEMVPDPIMETGGKALFDEYEKYLTDPDGWIKNRYRK